jgi:hypothetical protein
MSAARSLRDPVKTPCAGASLVICPVQERMQCMVN